MKVSEIIEMLKDYYAPDDELAYLFWGVDDIRYYVESMRSEPVDLSDDECKEIVAEVDRTADASIGLSWDSIETITEFYIDENNIKPKEVL